MSSFLKRLNHGATYVLAALLTLLMLPIGIILMLVFTVTDALARGDCFASARAAVFF